MAQHPEGLALELLVDEALSMLGVEHVWLNAQGESNNAADFRVRGVHLDAKGSNKYRGSGFLTVRSYVNDEIIDDKDPVWYVTNSLEVISFRELARHLIRGDHPEIYTKSYHDHRLGHEAIGARFVGLRSLSEWALELE